MAKKKFSIDKQTLSFLSLCGEIVAADARGMFDQNTWSFLHDHSIISPIEQRLYAAMQLVADINGYERMEPEEVEGQLYLYGFDIRPQVEIDKYRVDFLVTYYPYPQKNPDGSRTQTLRTVIVECDSQQWHERTEPERRYEKARDRHFMKAGYKVFHFTGAEIMKDPFEPAAEVVAFLVDSSKEGLREMINLITVNL